MEAYRETIIKGLFAFSGGVSAKSHMNAYTTVFTVSSMGGRFENLQEKVDWFESVIEEFFKRVNSRDKTLAVTSAFHEGCPLADEINLNVDTYDIPTACRQIGLVFAFYFRTAAKEAVQKGLRVRWTCKEDLMRDFA